MRVGRECIERVLRLVDREVYCDSFAARCRTLVITLALALVRYRTARCFPPSLAPSRLLPLVGSHSRSCPPPLVVSHSRHCPPSFARPRSVPLVGSYSCCRSLPLVVSRSRRSRFQSFALLPNECYAPFPCLCR